jgi:mRNA interferase HigB
LPVFGFLASGSPCDQAARQGCGKSHADASALASYSNLPASAQRSVPLVCLACQLLALRDVPDWDYHPSPNLGHREILMRVIALSTLKSFWQKGQKVSDAKEPILAWYRHICRADWATPSDVKKAFRSASILKAGRVVFNIAGNKYRIVVWINYPYRVVYIRFVGSHAEYDKIDVQRV